MIFYLQPPYEFEPLKCWYRENWKEIPRTLDCDDRYYMNLKETLKMNVASEDTEKLIFIYKALQVSENWNKPMEKLENSNRI